MLIAPVAVILVAENLGHLKAVAGMTGRSMDPYMGRAFVGDGLATMLSGLLDAGLRGGGSDGDAARLLAEVRRAYPHHSVTGHRGSLNRGVWSDRRGRRAYLGAASGRSQPERQPDYGGRHAGAGRRRFCPDAGRVYDRRDWHGDLRRDPA
ncbi:hypothetical protein L1887_45037 [Cichorium endivia]|nr:hypothetical protein L1887_45037 [Cichorium endivia]